MTNEDEKTLIRYDDESLTNQHNSVLRESDVTGVLPVDFEPPTLFFDSFHAKFLIYKNRGLRCYSKTTWEMFQIVPAMLEIHYTFLRNLRYAIPVIPRPSNVKVAGSGMGGSPGFSANQFATFMPNIPLSSVPQ